MFKELEERIKELEGVISCKITGDKNIDEIHIVASNNRDPKRIVRDIETMVLVNLDEEINHKKISIAQVNQAREATNYNRIEIVSIFSENNRPVCHLRLNINDNVIEEKITNTIEKSIPMMVAEGMVEILGKYTSFKGKIRVENVFTTGMNEEIIVVQLVVYEHDNFLCQERLIGSAYINQNLPLATGKACLKALNRRLNSIY
jgi:hypothetical protein